jgi:uncharacterized membrane protein YozB (DUF420 family)
VELLPHLPLLNAFLNTSSTILLVTGYRFIRNKNRGAHRRCMVSAVITSGLFLVSYLVYHYNVGSVRFTEEGTIRILYFGILLTHTVLAVSLPVLVPITMVRALRERFYKHAAIARVTFPIWIYVSATGVIIYVMLYQLFPQA